MNEKTRQLIRRSGLPYFGIQNDIFLEKLVQLVAEDCAKICNEMGITIAGWDGGVPTATADSCADRIRKDFDIK